MVTRIIVMILTIVLSVDSKCANTTFQMDHNVASIQTDGIAAVTGGWDDAFNINANLTRSSTTAGSTTSKNTTFTTRKTTTTTKITTTKKITTTTKTTTKAKILTSTSTKAITTTTKSTKKYF